MNMQTPSVSLANGTCEPSAAFVCIAYRKVSLNKTSSGLVANLTSLLQRSEVVLKLLRARTWRTHPLPIEFVLFILAIPGKIDILIAPQLSPNSLVDAGLNQEIVRTLLEDFLALTSYVLTKGTISAPTASSHLRRELR